MYRSFNIRTCGHLKRLEGGWLLAHDRRMLNAVIKGLKSGFRKRPEATSPPVCSSDETQKTITADLQTQTLNPKPSDPNPAANIHASASYQLYPD